MDCGEITLWFTAQTLELETWIQIQLINRNNNTCFLHPLVRIKGDQIRKHAQDKENQEAQRIRGSHGPITTAVSTSLASVKWTVCSHFSTRWRSCVVKGQGREPDEMFLLRILQRVCSPVEDLFMFLRHFTSAVFQQLGPHPGPQPLPPRSLSFPLGSSWAPLLGALSSPQISPLLAPLPL